MKPSSMLDRLAWATTATVAGAAACVALVAGGFSDRLAREREDRHLIDAAKTLATELEEPGQTPDYIVAKEVRELAHTGIAIAVFEEGRFVAGDASLVLVDPGACKDVARIRTCSTPARHLVAVAGRDRSFLRELRDEVWISSIVAGMLTSILGALFARRVARLLVAPLTRLGKAVSAVPESAPEEARLGPDEGIVEIDELRAELVETFHRLGESLATSRRFAADAAHELRTPIATILGELSLQARHLKGEDAATNERVVRIASRMAALVDRLLVLARPVSERPRDDVFDLHDAYDDAIEMIPVDAWPRIELLPPDCAPLVGDRVLVATMLANAIENALKFSEGPVRVVLTTEHDEVVARVADEGAGIPDAERARVFEPFYRTRSTRASGKAGHGIGLSLIAHVASVHGGSARFLDVARGATLEIRLPRDRR